MLGLIVRRNVVFVALKEETQNAKSKRRLEVDEYSAEALDFVEDVCLRLVQVSQPLDVDWGVDLAVVMNI